MAPPMDQKSNVVPANTSEDLLVRCKRTKFSGFIVDAQPGIEVSDMENKVSAVLVHKVSLGQDPIDVQSTGEANGSAKGHVHGNESARSRLPKICTVNGLKGPLYDFEEQGPPHKKMFTCKVTIYVDGIVNTVMECFGDPKHQKKVAQEHAAQAALWCLERFGYVK